MQEQAHSQRIPKDIHRHYRIPLQKRWCQWQPRHPSKKSINALQQSNNVYNIPSTDQAIKLMHVVSCYPVNTTWLKAVKVGNYTGCTLLTIRYVQKYYLETTETPKGHMNQTRKNVWSTKTKKMWINSLAFHRTRRVQQHFFLRQEGAQCLHKGVWCARHALFQSNWAIYNTIQRSQQVCHGQGVNRQHWHLSGSHE